MTRRGPERVTPDDGTETRSRLLREAAAENLPQCAYLRDGATPREGRSPVGCKLLSNGSNSRESTILIEAANFVPAAAVIRRPQALSGFIGRKASAG